MAKILPLPVARREKPISVIMVSYMTGPALLEAIHAVMADADISELILVDNGNTLEARKRLSDVVVQHDRIRLLQGHGNIGFARACNYGANLARGEYFLFLNPDALIAEGAARALADCGKNLKAPWITGGMLRNVNGQEQRGARRGALTPLSALVSFTPLHKLPFFKSLHKENETLPQHAQATGLMKITFYMLRTLMCVAAPVSKAGRFILSRALRSCIMDRQVRSGGKRLNGKN